MASSDRTSPSNSNNQIIRSPTKMSSPPHKLRNPPIGRTYTFKLPPNAAAPPVAPTPHLNSSIMPNIGSSTRLVEDNGQTIPTSELHIHMGQPNEHINIYQDFENASQPSLPMGLPAVIRMDHDYSSYLPPQETISPELLDNSSGHTECASVYPIIQENEFQGFDFVNTPLDGLPGFYGSLASPRTGEIMPTPRPSEASPEFTIMDSGFSLPGHRIYCDNTLGVGSGLPWEETVLAPSFFTTQQDVIGLGAQPHDDSIQLPHLPANGILLDDCFDFKVPDINSHLEQHPDLTLENTFDASAESFFTDITPQWPPYSTESPNQDTSCRQSRGRNGQRDTSKDELLVRCKARGMSYKQIKELGGFEEAESTLRGRYRALTKPREARLRRPEWGEREIQLLFDGVAHFSKPNSRPFRPSGRLDSVALDHYVNKIPWKQVAEYMENRGTYRYGNWTVKKKYMEVLKRRAISHPR